MDIYRIMPTTVTSERQSVSRREREDKERRDGAQHESPDPRGGARAPARATDADHAEAQVAVEQGKGRRLNVSA